MIRPMTAKDIVHVQRIAHLTWSETYDGIIPKELQTRFLNRSYSDAMLMKRMEKSVMLIAECQDAPIGFLNFTKIDNDGDAELIAMYILPAYQQSGYGKRLLQVALSMLAEATQLSVYVDGQNTIGRAFCEKHGFQLLDVFEEPFEGHPVVTAQYVYTFTHTI